MGVRLFITGGTGFFGKSMLDYRLRHPEWEWADAEWVVLSRSPEIFKVAFPRLSNQNGISFVAGDIRDFSFPAGPFDAIIHAATSALTTISDEEMMSVTVEGTRHVVEFAKAVGSPKILFTSSGAVYGPLTSRARETDPCNPMTAYGKGKLESERLLLDSGLDVKIARCFAFVGPYLNRKIHYAIGNFIQDCLDGVDIEIKGDGTSLRSYLYADDLVEWLFAILDNGRNREIYNVGSNEIVSIKELAYRVKELIGKESSIITRLSKSCKQPEMYVPEIEKSISLIGRCVRHDLASAIQLTVNSICANDIL